MARGFSKLPSNDGDEKPFHSHASLDYTETTYDDYRSIVADTASTHSLIDRYISKVDPKADVEDNLAPLRKSLKQYSTLVWRMLAMSTAILYGGYDSVILGTLNAVPAYQRDFGDWIEIPDRKDRRKMIWTWTIPALWLSLWDGIGPLGQIAGAALGGWLLDRKGRRFCLLLGV